MGTRSNIGVMNADGSVDVVYCHWDGYPEGVGACLVQCHNNEEEARKIISLGDISSLRERLEPSEEESHSFNNPIDDVTIFYGRDRGETGIEARHYENLQEWANYLCNGGWDIEFAYLFKDGEWHCHSRWGEGVIGTEINSEGEEVEIRGITFLNEISLEVFLVDEDEEAFGAEENIRVLFPILTREERNLIFDFLEENGIDFEVL